MEVPFPLGGINDLSRKTSQPPGTTSEGVNVHSIESTTGRARGGVRPGTSKYCSEDLSSPTAKIAALTSVVIDSRKLDYEGIQPTAVDSVLKFTAKDKQGLTVLESDELGNIYGVYGRGTVIKVNPDGRKIWERALPLPDPSSICRALAIGDSLEVYVATSTGKSVRDSRIWRIDQIEDDETEVVWEYTPKGFTEALRWGNSQLFAVENNSASQRSHLIVYGSLEANPAADRRTEIPYPVNDMRVRADGTCYTCHPPFRNRGLDPRFPSQTERTVDWTPRELDQWERRIWFWGKASSLGLDHDDPVLFLEDELEQRTITLAPQRDAPTYNESGLAGGPTISFSGDSSDPSRAQCMISGTNKSVQREYADQQNTLLPGYKGAQFAVFIVVRVSNEAGVSSPVRRAILAQNNSATGGGEDQVFGANTSGAAAAGGWFQWTAQTLNSGTSPLPGAGAGGLPAPYNYGARGEDVLLITAIYNSGLPAQSSTLIVAPTNGVAGPTNIQVYGINIFSGERFIRFLIPPGYSHQVGDLVTFTGPSTSPIFDPGETTHLDFGVQYTIDSSDGTYAYMSPVLSTNSFAVHPVNYAIERVVNTSNAVASVLRVNGNPVDRFQGEPFETYTSGYSGTGIGTGEIANIVQAATGYSPGKMDLAEVLVIHNPDYPSRSDPVSCPLYPRTLGNGVTSTPNTSAVVLAADAQFEVCKIEGYLAHAHGISHLLPTQRTNPSWTGTGFTSYDFGSFPHPYSRHRGPPRSTQDPDTIFRPRYLVQSKEGILAKWAADSGRMVWIATSRMPEANIGYVFGVGGIGYGLVLGEDESGEIAIFTYGPPASGLGGTNLSGIEDYCIARKFTDTGDEWDGIGVRCTDINLPGTTATTPATGSTLWSRTWADLFNGSATLTIPEIWTYQYGKMSSDSANNAYYPVALGPTAAAQLLILRTDGAYQITPAGGFVSTTSASEAYAVLPGRPEPEYHATDWDGLSANNSKRPEFVWLGYAAGAHADLEKIRLANLASTTGSPRQMVSACVVNGNIRTFTTSSVSTPPGGLGALDPDSETYASTQAFGQLFFTDGTKYKVYDPRLNRVSDWRSLRAGGIPEKCKGLELWRGRVVLYRGADNPQNYFMSAFDDPYDFDFQPPILTKTQAVAGSGAVGPGLVPDIINTFIPYTDDLAFWGCDHTIFRMTGDPADDGKIDLVSDVTGMGFGRCWAKDPNGIIYFWGSRGGVYRMVPGQVPERMTLNRIERRMTELDLASFRVEMAWDTDRNGLFVAMIPWGQNGSLVSHFFWEAQTDSWWEVRYCESSPMLAPGRQPSCLYVLDGDSPTDRVMLMGCFDGYIRKSDRLAKDDDGQPIDSRVLIGPFTGDDNEQAVLWGNPILVLSDQLDGCSLELLTSPNPDVPRDPVVRIDQRPGRNLRALVRARGSYVWVRLRSNRLGSRWAFESMTLDMLNLGAARAR